MKKLNVKIEQMQSSRGNDVPNQYIIYTDDGQYFQSYSSIIAFRGRDGKVALDRDKWDYSVTTGKYRNQFLNEGMQETRKKIDSGVYELADLN